MFKLHGPLSYGNVEKKKQKVAGGLLGGISNLSHTTGCGDTNIGCQLRLCIRPAILTVSHIFTSMHITCSKWTCYHVNHCIVEIPYRAAKPSPKQYFAVRTMEKKT